VIADRQRVIHYTGVNLRDPSLPAVDDRDRLCRARSMLLSVRASAGRRGCGPDPGPPHPWGRTT